MWSECFGVSFHVVNSLQSEEIHSHVPGYDGSPGIGDGHPIRKMMGIPKQWVYLNPEVYYWVFDPPRFHRGGKFWELIHSIPKPGVDFHEASMISWWVQSWILLFTWFYDWIPIKLGSFCSSPYIQQQLNTQGLVPGHCETMNQSELESWEKEKLILVWILEIVPWKT